MRNKQEVICKFCGETFLAVRNDAVRCKECRRNYLKEWRKKNTTIERRIYLHRKVREKAFAGYGGKCACCGETTFEFLAIDHKYGGGRLEREKLSTRQIADKVIKLGYPDEYQVLCHNCNMAKGFFGQCPHKWQRTA